MLLPLHSQAPISEGKNWHQVYGEAGKPHEEMFTCTKSSHKPSDSLVFSSPMSTQTHQCVLKLPTLMLPFSSTEEWKLSFPLTMGVN